MPPAIRTDPRLLALMHRAAQHKMTPREVREQRVSFVYGQMRGVTKEWVRAKLSENEGDSGTII